MVFLRLSAAIAGLCGLAVSVVLAIFAFAPAADAELGVTALLGGAGLEAVFTAATILWIIFGALCLYQLQERSGSLERLRDAIGSISGDTRIAAILIAWFFALFAEGAAGFGTAVALAAPFLVGFGFAPAQAVVITLIGHSVGVSFGAVGTPILAQAQLVPFAAGELGAAAASFHVVLGWVMLVALLRHVAPDSPTTVRGSIYVWVTVASAAYLVPMYLIAKYVGPELPTLGGAIVGGIVFVALFVAVQRSASTDGDGRSGQGASAVDILRAASPYLVVIGLVLITRLVGPIEEVLRQIAWAWSLWGKFRGEFSPLFHPGTLLTVGFFIGAFIVRASRREVADSLRSALRQLGPVTIALVMMLGLSRVMVHFGMIDALAEWSATAAGVAWPFFAPWVGVLGTFVTGSATASNILFSEFQYATTTRLEMPALIILGAQSFGAAVGNIICPHNIIAGGATVGISGEEGAILRKTLGACLLYAMLGGVLCLLYVYV